jgi:hypothetical protein
MKLVEIKIRGYKSIEELDFPVTKYGEGDNASFTTILIGKNETGKSNVLDAMATPQNKETVAFEDYKSKQQGVDASIVSVLFGFDVEDGDDYHSAIAQAIEIPQQLLDSLTVTKLYKEMYLQKSFDQYEVDCDYEADKLGVKKYSYVKVPSSAPATPATPETPATDASETVTIKANSDLTDEEKETYIQLDAESFKGIIKQALLDFVIAKDIPVDVWKSEEKEKYLVPEQVQLKEFIKSTDANIPLKNIFYLAGYTTDEDITAIVNEAEKSNNERLKLGDTLGTKSTEYLNQKWNEHEIEIEVRVESDLSAYVYVKDKSDKSNRFNMADRSQGFKQFVSLLLSISISSLSGDIKDHLVLIDEPEVHLHPSGIRWMRDELLEIGKNNYLFISTHSNFMIDEKTKDRHYLLTKNKAGLTQSRQIKTEEDITNDDILKSAFGINVIADFLPERKLLVEGATDKNLLETGLAKMNKDHNISIANGTGNSIVATASLMAFYRVSSMVVTDDDEAGRKMKTEIEKIGDELFKGNVYTIRNLNGNIIEDGSIEDALPMTFLQSEANKVLKKKSIADITLDDKTPFCSQITLHLQKEISEDGKTKKDKKQEVDDILVAIKTGVSRYSPKSSFKTDAPKLYDLAEAILKQFGIAD